VEQAGNDVTVDIPFPYYFLADADLKVYVDDALQTITTDYTVTGAGVGAGGTVSMHVAPATGETAVVFRDPAITQTKDWVENDPDPAEQKEEGFDLLTMICQRLSEQIGRSFVLADSDTSGISLTLPTPVANRLLAINSDATALTLAEFIDSIFVHQSATPATDGSLYLWLNSATGVFYYLDESISTWIPVDPIPNTSVGDIGNPLLHVPLKNSLSLAAGVGSITFTRSTVATYIDRYGVVQDAAIDAERFEAEGLLMEGASTNEILQSESFAWTNQNITLTANAIDAPDGTTTADKIEATAADAYVSTTMTGLVSDTGEKTFSLFIKGGDAAQTTVDLQPLAGGAVTTHTVNWSGGVPTPSGTGTMIALADGWYRWEMQVTNESKTQMKVWIRPAGPTATEYIYVWGAQYEELAFVTSYIPTSGTAVTRTTETCVLSFAENHPNIQAGNPFTVVVDVDAVEVASGLRSFVTAGQNEVGVNDFSLLRLNDLDLQYYRSDTPLAVTSSGYASMKRYGITVDTSENTKAYIDGVLTASADAVSLSDDTGVNAAEISIGGRPDGGAVLYGHVSNLRIYDDAFSTEVMRIL
jgi:hypothetical protein